MTVESRSLVSVVIPAYNAQSTLAAAVGSALAQSHEPIEVIVVDDGSTDATASVALGLGGRIRLERQENRGVSSARNRGVDVARGEFVAFLDADDTWRRDKLLPQMEALAEPRIGAAICEIEHVDARGLSLGISNVANVLGLEFGLRRAVELLQFSASCLVVRRQLLENLGGFDESLTTAEDIDIVLRIAAVSRLRVVDRPLMRYRVSDSSLSRSVFTGNRLRVLAKLRDSGLRRRLAPGTLRRAEARVHTSYGRDLLWHGRMPEARRQLFAAFQSQPDWAALCRFLKSLVPRQGIALARRLVAHRP